ncbi:hypothetical protein BJX65DRAFT_313392 [Aspergillus insuetus]
MALRDPRSCGHLLRDPVSNNGAPCDGCPLYFCYRHLYLNWDGAMCQRAKHLFLNDEPVHTTHALVAHWIAWGPLQGYAVPGTVHFSAPAQDATEPATTRPRLRRRVRFANDVGEIPPRQESVWDGVWETFACDVLKFLATGFFLLIAMIPIMTLLAQIGKLLEFFGDKANDGEL